MTSSKNQKNRENGNETNIDLKECEIKLKKVYNISEKEPLYIIKIDIDEKGMHIPKIEYEVFYPFVNNTLTQLNLSICKDISIDLLIPVPLIDDLDKHNKSSDYYNNICSRTTSKSGTDITLKDRRDEFVENNMTLCEEDCNLVDYNFTNQKAKCSCLVKIEIPIINEIKFNKTRLYNSFTDIQNFSNILIIKCYEIVFKLKNLKSNIGFLFFEGIILLYVISLIIFVSKGYFSLIKNFYEIIQAKDIEFKSNNKNQIKKKKENTIKNSINNNIKTLGKRKNIKLRNKVLKNGKKKYKKFPPKKLRQINFKSEIKNNKNSNNNQKTNVLSLKKAKNKKLIHNTSSSINQRILNNNYLCDYNNNMITNTFNSKRNLNYNKILEKNDQELNSLNYKEAITDDKRTYVQYYLSLLRANHLLIFSFYKNDRDYNSRIIKIFLFFFFFCVHFTVNALFFNDSTMHKIYIDEGSFNFIYQIPQIILSALISGVINFIIKYLANDVIKDELKLITVSLIK